MNLDEYQAKAFATARIEWDDPEAQHIPALGVIGELGSVASELKKIIRDGDAYTEGRKNLGEEFGDLLWYLAAVATRHRLKLGAIAQSFTEAAMPRAHSFDHIYALVAAVANLVSTARQHDLHPQASTKKKLVECIAEALKCLLFSLRREKLKLASVLKANLTKGDSKFGLSPEQAAAPCYDRKFRGYERLPRLLHVNFLERGRGKGRVEVLLRCRGMNIGDRLTDNARKDDGYRYHDVFHLANAAVLGWSPVLRSILRCKRKSNSKVDETQDGARAAIVEEAIAHTVFQYAESHSLLKDLKHIDHGVLLLIQRMVKNLEIEKLAMHEWERAIFVGFEAFRSLKKNKGGWLTLDAETRSLTFSRGEPASSSPKSVR